jgi:DNA-binding Lrp family transcriptional regulator
MDRDDEGRFSASVSDEEVVDAVARAAPVGTSAVAKELGITRQAADYRLRRLREAGRVEADTIGGSLAWSVSAGEAPAEEPTPSSADTEPAPPPLDARVRALDVPGSGSRLDARVAATVRLVEYLEAEGEATAEELKALLDADDVGYATVESYWANFIRGPGVLKELDEVEAPGKGGKVYRYRGDRGV